ncbi:cytochrome P450 76A1-like, partial [Pistacia vera]|uniref:cytochrome P450 76A1-like n=1 Tax=Pistacia vera TaxID=55513 RepID=UPI001263777B
MSLISFIVFLIIISASTLLLRRRKSSLKQLPPGPPGWPIFGNMFELGSMPHRTLTDLRDKYGEVIWLKFGAINTMVVLSAKAASDFFKNHDLSFAERTVTEIMRAYDYDKSSLALASYGSFWRVLRRLVTVDMIVHKRINETASIRRKCVNDMLLWIEKEALQGNGDGRRCIHVARFVFLSTFNLLGNLMLSRDLLDPDSKDGAEFFTSMMGLMEWGGHPNISDFFPFLRWLDPQGLKRKMKRDLGKALKIASKFVKERVEENKEGDRERKDFLDVLLDFEGNGKDEPAKLSEQQLNIFILEIFLAGSETTSSSIEWALTELLCNLDSLNRAKAELAEVVGPNGMFEESDIENLPYLQAVIKETLRLHPPIPFLVPRRAMEDTNFNGYHIPKNTQVLINAWAIGRDPEVWSDPLSFKPERFLGSKVDYKGQNYELIPFGAGRRMCAGVPLAHRMLNLILGSLLHEFDWELDGNVCKETMDMKDRLGITMRKDEPLFALPKR